MALSAIIAPLTLIAVIVYYIYKVVVFFKNIKRVKETKKLRVQQAKDRIKGILEQMRELA